MAHKQVLYIDSWKVPKLIKYEVAYNKLWADDSGRDLAGNNKATLIGIFPKLQVEVGSYNEEEMSQFLKKVNKAKWSINWYDAETKAMRNGVSYYINDFSVSLKNTAAMKYNGFNFNLIPNKKR